VERIGTALGCFSLLILFGIPGALWWFSGEMCENSIVRTVDSPDGKRTLALFERSCGATTGFSTQISVLGRGEVSTGSGNAFIADANHGAAPLGEWGGPWAEIQWLANEHVLIRYAQGSRVFEKDEQVSGVKITYQPVTR
jgi:hypothetical protein